MDAHASEAVDRAVQSQRGRTWKGRKVSEPSAERLSLQRSQEAERRALLAQTEESNALQGFLSSWHQSLDAKLEQFASQLRSAEKRAEQSSAQALRSGEQTEALQLRLDGAEARLETLQQSLAQVQGAELAVSSRLEALAQSCGAELRTELEALRGELMPRLEAEEKKQTEVAGTLARLEEGWQQTAQALDAQAAEARKAMEAQESTAREQAAEQRKLDQRLQELDARTLTAHRSLRALEPFVEQVTARLEPLAGAVEGLRSELSANGQVQRTALAAEASKAQEAFEELRSELGQRKRSEESTQAKLEALEASMETALRQEIQDIHKSQLQVTDMHVKMREEIQASASTLTSRCQDLGAQLQELGTASAKELAAAERRMHAELQVWRQELSSALRAAAEASGASDTAAQRAEELQQQLAALKLEVETLESLPRSRDSRGVPSVTSLPDATAGIFAIRKGKEDALGSGLLRPLAVTEDVAR
ncbi:unnamed protein product [Effrenium voratum]|nr:unnamed protein product [Effrenium voratum]